jgi:hypothetical protein
MTKQDLKSLVVEALRRNTGSATVRQVCRDIWDRHRTELEQSGDLLYTWQYDVRWAAHALRREGTVRPVSESPRGVWELV